MRPRIVLVALITGALLTSAAWRGILWLLLEADRVHALPIIGAFVLWSVWKGWHNDWASLEWWAKHLPIVGLVLTSYGILEVYPEVLAGGDYNTIRAHTIMALLPNCIAGAGALWLLILRRVCDR